MYLQLTLSYTPIQTGLAFLPLTLTLAFGSTYLGRRLVLVLPSRLVLLSSYVVAFAIAAGLMVAAAIVSVSW